MKGTKAFEPVRARHKALRGCMAFVLAFGLCGVAPTVALASEESAIAEWQAAVDQMDSPSYQPYSYADTSNEAVPAANSLEEEKTYGSVDAESFDLRDHGLVTPVKLQNPWGTCWGFAAIAAAEYAARAQAVGATLECDARAPEDVGVGDVHLCRLLSNMLDNAVEGCRAASDLAPVIRFAMRQEDGFLFMSCDNPCDEAVLHRRGTRFASTKQDAARSGHGLGLGIMAEIAEAYDGSFECDASGRRFRVFANLCIRKESDPCTA